VGGKYPMLLNSDSGASSISATCGIANSPALNKRSLLTIDDFQLVLNTMLKDLDAGVAIPLASGQFKVARFSLEGSNEALAAVNGAKGHCTAGQFTRSNALNANSLRRLLLSVAAAVICSSPYAQSTGGLGQFPTEESAQVHCPKDTVVWLNLPTMIWHYKGQRWYGMRSIGSTRS
jgi:hypothetical protein